MMSEPLSAATVTAPGQADEQTALSALIHGRFEEARGRHGVDPDRVARFILDSNWLAARDRAVREAARKDVLEGINKVIDKHPLNGRYGFTRDDVIQQLLMQAVMTGAEAFGSQSRGASRMMVKQETVTYLALFTEAAIRAAANPFASSGDTTNGDK